MIEIPESKVFASRAENTLRGKVVVDVINATNPHRFAWYHGDPLLYSSILIQGFSLKMYFRYMPLLPCNLMITIRCDIICPGCEIFYLLSHINIIKYKSGNNNSP